MIFFCFSLFFYSIISISRQWQWKIISLCSFLAFTCFTLSFATLSFLHLQNAFHISNILSSVHSTQPILFKFSSIWGSHSGSLFLWCWILSFYHVLYTFLLKKHHHLSPVQQLSFSYFAAILVFFQLFLLLTSNPLMEVPVTSYDGWELNPILQDVVLSIHPPLIYLGYLGSVVPFSLLFASLFSRSLLSQQMVREVRFFLRFSWIFLTLGILLGSWWAYYELGWGGFWFWDPVENASLIPWMMFTMFLHQNSSSNLSWYFLSFFTFFSSVAGTFLVRSGLLDSVHSFAFDSLKGSFILAFMTFSLFLFLYGLITTPLHTTSSLSFSHLSLWNQILLSFLLFFLIIGTLAPVFSQIIFQTPFTIGPSFYHLTMIPLMIPLLFLMNCSHYVSTVTSFSFFQRMRWSFLFSLSFTITLLFFLNLLSWESFFTKFILFLSLLCLFSILQNISYKTLHFLHHFGVALATAGLSLWHLLATEKHLILFPGDSVTLGQRTWVFRDLNFLKGPNYDSFYANVALFKDSSLSGVLFPEKRHYYVTDTYSSKVDIQSNLFCDYHIHLGDGHLFTGWATHLFSYPFLSFFWISSLFFLMASLFILKRDSKDRRIS